MSNAEIQMRIDHYKVEQSEHTEIDHLLDQLTDGLTYEQVIAELEAEMGPTLLTC